MVEVTAKCTKLCILQQIIQLGNIKTTLLQTKLNCKPTMCWEEFHSFCTLVCLSCFIGYLQQFGYRGLFHRRLWTHTRLSVHGATQYNWKFRVEHRYYFWQCSWKSPQCDSGWRVCCSAQAIWYPRCSCELSNGSVFRLACFDNTMQNTKCQTWTNISLCLFRSSTKLKAIVLRLFWSIFLWRVSQDLIL